ncbi:MAG: hypothetical protein AB7U20_22980 [Planctomycetaceae bacterium]
MLSVLLFAAVRMKSIHDACGRRARLPFVMPAFALILRNMWVWCHLNWLAVRRGPGIVLRDDLLRLRKMTLWLQHPEAVAFGLVLTKLIPTDDDPSLELPPRRCRG